MLHHIYTLEVPSPLTMNPRQQVLPEPERLFLSDTVPGVVALQWWGIPDRSEAWQDGDIRRYYRFQHLQYHSYINIAHIYVWIKLNSHNICKVIFRVFISKSIYPIRVWGVLDYDAAVKTRDYSRPYLPSIYVYISTARYAWRALILYNSCVCVYVNSNVYNR